MGDGDEAPGLRHGCRAQGALLHRNHRGPTVNIRNAIATLGIVLVPAAASAQCGLTQYEVPGIVVDRDGAPVPTATVEAEWEEKATGFATTRSQSGPDGRFLLTVQFDAYSGQTFTGSPKCEAKLEEITLRVAKSDVGQREIEVELADSKEITVELR